MSIVVAITSLWMTAQAVPPPMEQMTADCDRPIYASDQFICADPDLARQERDLAVRWRAVEAAMPKSAWIEDQPAWFKRRAMCAFQTDQGACLRDANAERERLFVAILDPADGALRTARCVGDGRRQTFQLDVRDGVVAAHGEAGFSWIAGQRTSEWSPFNTVISGRSLTIQRQDGIRLSCRFTH